MMMMMIQCRYHRIWPTVTLHFGIKIIFSNFWRKIYHSVTLILLKVHTYISLGFPLQIHMKCDISRPTGILQELKKNISGRVIQKVFGQFVSQNFTSIEIKITQSNICQHCSHHTIMTISKMIFKFRQFSGVGLTC